MGFLVFMAQSPWDRMAGSGTAPGLPAPSWARCRGRSIL